MLSHFDTILQHDRRIDGRTEFRYQYWQTDREESCNKLHGDDMTECCGKRSLCVVYWHRNINTSSSAFNHIHRLRYQLSVLDTHTHTHQSHHTSLLEYCTIFYTHNSDTTRQARCQRLTTVLSIFLQSHCLPITEPRHAETQLRLPVYVSKSSWDNMSALEQNSQQVKTSSSVVAERPCVASCHWIFC